jgi:hypothetical protein
MAYQTIKVCQKFYFCWKYFYITYILLKTKKNKQKYIYFLKKKMINVKSIYVVGPNLQIAHNGIKNKDKIFSQTGL